MSRSGYTLKGWKCPDGTVKTPTAVVKDVVVGNSFYVAQWSTRKYTVTFHGNGGEPETMSRTYDYGQKIGYFPILDKMKPGSKKLTGWFTAASGGTKVTENKIVTANLNLYAQWEDGVADTCTVKFFKHDGVTKIEERTVVKGSRIGTLSTNPYPNPGYSFRGWYTKVEGGTQIMETKVVNNDLNLYAQWNASMHVITWNPNYSGGATTTWTRAYGTELGDLPELSRVGYRQNGWWTASSGGSQISKTTKVQGNVTYWAHWNATGYTITYVLNGLGTMASSAPTTYNATQLPLSIPNANPNSGNTFKGWTGSNGTTPQKNISIPVGSTGAKTYYANWEGKTYTVHFSPNGGTGSMDDQTFQFNVYQRLRDNTFTKYYAISFNGNGGTPAKPEILSYLKFLGWAKTTSGDVAYANKANVVNITTGTNVTLYAKWGAADKISLPNASRSGYSFTGWYTSSSGGTKIGNSGDEYTPTRDIAFYAHWTANSYTVTFDPTLGTVSTRTRTVTFGRAYGTPWPVAESDEYEFLGWFTEANGGTQVTSSTIVTTPRNHTLYAHWKTGKMTLTFDPNNGTMPPGAPNMRRCWIGRPFGELPVPTRTGYFFIGWFDSRYRPAGAVSGSHSPSPTTEPAEGQVTAETIAPEEDITIYAEWIPIEYTVHYDANGGTGSMDDQIMTYDDPAFLYPNQFSRESMRFKGWSDTPSGTVKWEDGESVENLTTTAGETVTMYAIWQYDPIEVTFYSNWDQYVMTFDANGGQGGYSRKFDKDAYVPQPEVTKTNNKFVRWEPAAPMYMPDHNVTCVAQWTPYSLTATVTTQDATATCSNVQPPGTTVQYSTSSKTSGYQAGTQFTMPFTANRTQTKTGWFKLLHPTLGTAIYQVEITQKVTKTWSAWSSPSGPWSASAVAAWKMRLENQYGVGNVEVRAAQNSHGFYAQERHTTSSSTSYTSKVTKVE